MVKWPWQSIIIFRTPHSGLRINEQLVDRHAARRQALLEGRGFQRFNGLEVFFEAIGQRVVADDAAAIAVEVTGNGGVDRLLGMTIAGSAVFNAEFRVAPEHLVSEVLIHAVRKGQGDWIVRPREVSLEWVAE